MRETPKELQVYKHFKGSLYQIVAIAVHTETTDKLVIYRSLTHPERVFARPLEMFLSEVNHKKYPDIKAKYRFTLLEEVKDESSSENPTNEEKSSEKIEETEVIEKPEDNKMSEDDEKPEENEKTEESVENSDVNEEKPVETDDTAVYREDGSIVLDPVMERILDSKEYTDKIEAFELLRGKCDESMLATLAIALDIQLTGETIDEQYADILKCLKMHQKYETNRLR